MDVENRKKLSVLRTEAVDELNEIPKQSVRSWRLTKERILELAHISLSNIRKKIEKLRRVFSEEEGERLLNYIDNLERLSLVCFAMDLAYHDPKEEEQQRSKELAEKCRKHDHYLFKWAFPLFEEIKELRKILDLISNGTGPLDDAVDTLREVGLFRENWDFAEGKTPVTLEYLDEAEKDATEYVELAKKIEQIAIDKTRDLRNRAFTAWYEAYSEIRFVGLYICRRDKNAAKMFPGAYMVKSKKPHQLPEAGPSVEIIE